MTWLVHQLLPALMQPQLSSPLDESSIMIVIIIGPVTVLLG